MAEDGTIVILNRKMIEQDLCEIVKDLKETANFLYHYHTDLYGQSAIVTQAADAIKALSADGEIGTVEEFRNIMEKSKAKKPIRIDMCTCPKCGTYNEAVKKRRNTVHHDIVYCWHCGQAMEVEKTDVVQQCENVE